jgi:MoaA/NifB/PqqE/SkfB family radical SAM enzyme
LIADYPDGNFGEGKMNIKKNLKLLLPPIAVQAVNKLHEKFMKSTAPASLEKRVCHFQELFIRHSGEVYPCCRVWNQKNLKIGHINDIDLKDKIGKFSGRCHCGEFKLIPASPLERHNYQLLNIELSLACQGACAMCCVDAPDWKGTYDYYNSLTTLIHQCKPKEILVQGGEVLIQRKSLDWLLLIKKDHPYLRISLVTNGNVPDDVIDTVSKLFNRVTISFPGFQPESYATITGMELTRSKRFAEKLSESSVDVYLKFLLTPLSFYEAASFLDWATLLHPQQIQFVNSGIESYMKKETRDKYWEKILARTAEKFRSHVISNKDTLEKSHTRLVFFEDTLKILKIDNEFIKKNHLQNIIHLNMR